MRAVLNGTVVAESDQTVVVEGTHYFPPDAIVADLFTPTDLNTVCPWKGTASHYTVTVDGEAFENVAWSYPNPKAGAADIKDHVAFERAVTLEG